MNNKNKKFFLNFLFLAVVFGLTLHFLLKDQELPLIFDAIKEAKKTYLGIGIILVLAFVCSESVIIYYMMAKLKYTVKFLPCIKYSFIGFFVSCITPSASGGQPAQVYYMSRDGLDISVSSLILMYITVAYKAVLIIISGVMFLFKKEFIISNIGNVKYILFYGIIINIAFISFLLIVMFKENLARRFVRTCIRLGSRIKLIKNSDMKMEHAMRSLDNYSEGAKYIRQDWKMTINVFAITMAQRIFLFLVTYVVYKSFGLSGTSALSIVTLQTIISLSVDMLPLPGGIGASEASFVIMFASIFGEKYLMPGMLLSRGISYYLLVLISGIVTCAAHIISQKKRER